MHNHRNVLVTGASGFIGRNLCVFLKEKGFRVRAAVRSRLHDIAGVDEYAEVGNIGPETDWAQALVGIDTVVHLAARVHIIKESAMDSLEAFRKVNVQSTECLARRAAQAGVRGVILLSTIGVNGEIPSERPFTENDIPSPVSAYAVSKWEAEQALHKISKETGMEIVILRLPLVYGPKAPGNFGRLVRLIKAGLPLPLGKITSSRSFIYLDNLVDAIFTCINHPLAAGETFLVSDGQDVSTPDLIKMIACAMKKKAALFSLHPGILKVLCKIVGKDKELEKLTGPFLVDSSKIRNLLGWKPPFTLEEGIRETVKEFGVASALCAWQ